ncbi:unnamed protein product [Caenorhabditis sp. 36 PRJEB53466]|nr:unnamed protein product [Caenorhabditis sp. 36 PRJEB53466]
MFAVPTLRNVKKNINSNNTRKIISKQEMEKFAGKLRCLHKLIRHPKASAPELQPSIFYLFTFLQFVTLANEIPFDEAYRNYIDGVIKQITDCEDIVIRVVLRGENFYAVFQEKAIQSLS